MLKQIERIHTLAKTSDEMTLLEKENNQLSKEIASEAIVLLKNDGILPLKNNEIALYGVGASNTVKGGIGSGEVNERESISIYDGLKNEGFHILNEKMIKDYIHYSKRKKKEYERNLIKEVGWFSFKATTMENIDSGYHDAEFFDLENYVSEKTDTCIYVISRLSGEGIDRGLQKGDYYLSDIEVKNLKYCKEHYKNVILVINSGGMIDLSSIDDLNINAILFIGMLGQAGGSAFASIIKGDISPSGHLSDTWSYNYEDIPFAKEYSYLGNSKVQDYKEDIFVGYRYFETFNVKPRFCFGFGLSYTKFKTNANVKLTDTIEIQLHIENIGNYPGKYVSQIYTSIPDNKNYQASSILIGFDKSKTILPNESEDLKISIPYYLLSTYSYDYGYILEKGRYILYEGDSIENKKAIGYFDIDEEIKLEKLDRKFDDIHFDILKPNKKKDIELPLELKLEFNKENVTPFKKIASSNPMDLFEDEAKKLVKKMAPKELVKLLYGSGGMDIALPFNHDIVVPGAVGNTTNKLHKYHLYSFACLDGPQGLRFSKVSVVKKRGKKIRYIEPPLYMFRFLPRIVRLLMFGKKGTRLYSYATAFPSGISLASTWNKDLCYKMGDAVAKEMAEYAVTLWLAPGMNIHRNPLCGRNFEYLSEDPILTGFLAKEIVSGVQANKGRYCTIKHFFLNNQEYDRKWMSANVSERAIREIYLKGFEIAVKLSDARCIMSSYNKVNEVWSGRNETSLTDILRDEWNFNGFVTTDWDTSHEGLEADASIKSGINILMPGEKKQAKVILKALNNNQLDIETLRQRAIKIVEIMLLNNTIYHLDK